MSNKKMQTPQFLNTKGASQNTSFKLQNIAIFASGAGSNAQKIIDYFRESGSIKVVLIVCNNPAAGVLQIAQKEKIPYILIDIKSLLEEDELLLQLQSFNIDFIVLSGFLLKIPSKIIAAYIGKALNIHPALLPEFGGKGMYGVKVHEAVINAGKKESGITIHYVDEVYDHGKIIFQAKCIIDKNDNADSLAKKIHELEYANYAKIIERLVLAQPLNLNK